NPKLVSSHYGTRQIFTNDLIFCSVTLSPSAADMIYKVVDGGVYRATFPSIRFTSASTISVVTYDENLYTFWIQSPYCNPDDVSTSNSSQ
ncbi:hypothetical protein PFISCL1PPCAC_18652, partial [Pristionchus fissidentatus]